MSKKDDNKTYYKRLAIIGGAIVAVIVIFALATTKPPATQNTEATQDRSGQDSVKVESIEVNLSGTADTATREFSLRQGLVRCIRARDCLLLGL